MARIIDSPAMNLVGSRVRALRLERKMSQQTLSNKPETLAIYVCRGSISQNRRQTAHGDRHRTV